VSGFVTRVLEALGLRRPPAPAAAVDPDDPSGA
jgi:hypothetical protein